MFNVCIITEDSDVRQDIKNLVNSFCSDYGINYEMDYMDNSSPVAAEIWMECGYDLALFDISEVDNREKLMNYSLNIRKHYQKTKMIFISDDLMSSLDVFDYSPDYFVYKPQLGSRLIPALEHLFRLEVKNKGSNLVISTKSAKHIIPERSILYFEHYQHSTKIVCEDRTIICHEKLSMLLERLNSKVFVRCHCSFVVNLQHVREFRRTQIFMSNSEVVPCSRSNQKSVKDALAGLRVVAI